MYTIEEMAAQVAAHPDYRVLRHYVQPKEYLPDDGTTKAIGLFVDTETTGLDKAQDQIIELGMVQFSYGRDTGKIYKILEVFSQFEDPGRSIPAYIVSLTGITDQMVRGQRIDDDAVAALSEASNLIIAHNASFDRTFMERRFPLFKKLPWACSIEDVPWHDEGIRSRSLDYLAYQYGFFYSGHHRASNDCLAALHILAQQLPLSKRYVFKVLLESARRKTNRIWAISAPFEKKDLLKARGYQWNPGQNGRPKSWYRDMDSRNPLDKEKHYLTSTIGCSEQQLIIDEITAYNRYSEGS